MAENPSEKPRIGLGVVVNHPAFGRGKIMAYENGDYVVLFKGGETKRVAFTFEAMRAEASVGDPETDRIKNAVREVLGEYGWLDVDLEMGKRWVGGTLKLIPGKEDTQPKDIPIDMFLKKIIGIRDKLRVLEQKVNAHPNLSPEDKIEMEGYITRCYGSLTTFNVLFASKESQFRGQSEKE
ncbi:MAG TPA: hypothetical protein VEK08_20290 [Planctomycetota bacterium]|nr:hypothetical protein [Planctomycetota bacterium]